MKMLFSGIPLLHHPRGVAVHLQNIANALSRHHPDLAFSVLVPETSQLRPPNSIVLSNRRCFRHALLNELSWMHCIARAAIREQNSCIFISPMEFYSLYRPARTIVTIHDATHHLFRDTSRSLPRRAFRWLSERYAKRCCKTFTVSAFSKSELVKRTPLQAEHIAVTPNWIPDEFLLRKRPTPPSRDYILYSGGYAPNKNLARTIEAYANALVQNRRLPPLFLTGTSPRPHSGSRNTDAEALFDRFKIPREKRRFLGRVPTSEMPDLYANAAAALYPSLYEGFGYPALEATALGCPLITSKGSPMAEFTRNPNCLVDPASVEEIAQAILQCVDRPDDFVATVPEPFTEKAGIQTYLNAIMDATGCELDRSSR